MVINNSIFLEIYVIILYYSDICYFGSVKDSLRVITGIAKGRKLKAPRGMNTRPTTDRVKESLFNILGEKVINSVFLDLFAGTGSIGIEALSRGASEAVFIEKDVRVYKIILENLAHTGLADFGEVYRQDVQRALSLLGKRQKKFDIIFADPPYLQYFERSTLENICRFDLIKPDGIVVVESSTLDQLPERVLRLQKYRTEKYGNIALNFYGVTKW